jgi:hypothetical protein
MLKKKRSSEMSFTIDSSEPVRKKKKTVRESASSAREDIESVEAAKNKMRKQQFKNKKAPRAPSSKEEAEIVEAVVKKKKKKSMAIATIPHSHPSTDLVTSGKKRISKLVKKDMVSIIGDDAEEMQNLFEEGSTDQATQMLNRRLIQMCIDIIPSLETGVRNSNGRYSVHALNNTIQTIRELMIDLQSAQDRGAIGMSIVDQIIRPTVLEIATKIVEEQATVLAEVKDLIPEQVYGQFRQAQIDSRNRLGQMMGQKFDEIKDRTVQFLQR